MSVSFTASNYLDVDYQDGDRFFVECLGESFEPWGKKKKPQKTLEKVPRGLFEAEQHK